MQKFFLTLILMMEFFMNANAADNTKNIDKENILYLDVKYGRVVIELLPEEAPKTVARIKQLVREKFYDGLKFHRVVPHFVVQGGDPTGTGMGGSGQNIPAEFNKEHHTRGAVSMARAQDINSADSQFFIVLEDALFLDGQYTLWGRVIEGMNYVDMIKQGDPRSGTVKDPDVIIKMSIAADDSK
jgi:peptidylprolyl isomerase